MMDKAERICGSILCKMARKFFVVGKCRSVIRLRLQIDWHG